MAHASAFGLRVLARLQVSGVVPLPLLSQRALPGFCCVPQRRALFRPALATARAFSLAELGAASV
eukprot:7582955-Alexandrium_andersonii.AAC.1